MSRVHKRRGSKTPTSQWRTSSGYNPPRDYPPQQRKQFNSSEMNMLRVEFVVKRQGQDEDPYLFYERKLQILEVVNDTLGERPLDEHRIIDLLWPLFTEEIQDFLTEQYITDRESIRHFLYSYRNEIWIKRREESLSDTSLHPSDPAPQSVQEPEAQPKVQNNDEMKLTIKKVIPRWYIEWPFKCVPEITYVEDEEASLTQLFPIEDTQHDFDKNGDEVETENDAVNTEFKREEKLLLEFEGKHIEIITPAPIRGDTEDKCKNVNEGIKDAEEMPDSVQRTNEIEVAKSMELVPDEGEEIKVGINENNLEGAEPDKLSGPKVNEHAKPIESEALVAVIQNTTKLKRVKPKKMKKMKGAILHIQKNEALVEKARFSDKILDITEGSDGKLVYHGASIFPPMKPTKRRKTAQARVRRMHTFGARNSPPRKFKGMKCSTAIKKSSMRNIKGKGFSTTTFAPKVATRKCHRHYFEQCAKFVFPKTNQSPIPPILIQRSRPASKFVNNRGAPHLMELFLFNPGKPPPSFI